MTEIRTRRGSVLDAYGLAPILAGSSRDQLVIEVDEPTSANTGLPDRSPAAMAALKVVTSPSQLPGGALIPGRTYVGYDFRFTVRTPVSSSKITFRECRASGTVAAPGTTTGLFRAADVGGCPTEWIDCDFEPITPNAFWVGVHGGKDTTLLRCRFRMLVDPVEVFPPLATKDAPVNFVMKQCLTEMQTWWPPGTPGTSSDGSHSDAIQYQGGKDALIQGNAFHAYLHPDYYNTVYSTNRSNNCILVHAEPSVCVADGTGEHISGLKYWGNWCYGGGGAGTGTAALIFSHTEPNLWLPRVANSETSLGSVLRNKYERGSAMGPGRFALWPVTTIVVDRGSGADINYYIDDPLDECTWTVGPD